MVCKLCQGEHIRIKKDIRSPHNNKLYHLYSCSDCKSHFFDIEQHAASLKELYNELSASRGHFPQAFRPERKWQYQVRLIEQLLPGPLKSILDVGCRTGDFLMHIPSDVRRDGIELSDHFAGIAVERGLTIYNDYLENISFSDKYDAVSCFAILEHLQNPVVFLNRLSEILNPGGLLIILIPVYDCLKRRWIDFLGKHWHMYTPPEHLMYYSRHFLDNFLKAQGFTRVHRYYTSGGLTEGFKGMMPLNQLLKKTVSVIDRSFINRFPLFDHMYSYYEFRDTH